MNALKKTVEQAKKVRPNISSEAINDIIAKLSNDEYRLKMKSVLDSIDTTSIRLRDSFTARTFKRLTFQTSVYDFYFKNTKEGIERRKKVEYILDRSEEHTSELQSRFDLVCR